MMSPGLQGEKSASKTLQPSLHFVCYMLASCLMRLKHMPFFHQSNLLRVQVWHLRSEAFLTETLNTHLGPYGILIQCPPMEHFCRCTARSVKIIIPCIPMKVVAPDASFTSWEGMFCSLVVQGIWSQMEAKFSHPHPGAQSNKAGIAILSSFSYTELIKIRS